jgi:hypothetical protein
MLATKVTKGGGGTRATTARTTCLGDSVPEGMSDSTAARQEDRLRSLAGFAEVRESPWKRVRRAMSNTKAGRRMTKTYDRAADAVVRIEERGDDGTDALCSVVATICRLVPPL